MTTAVEVRCTASTYDRLVRHLASSAPEQLAFLAVDRDLSGDALVAVDLKLIERVEFGVQTSQYLALADGVGGSVIRWAHGLSAGVVEAHAHRYSARAAFSLTDMDGLRIWAPHVLWRLPNRPYAALVFGDETFDGLIWEGGDAQPRQLAGLRVDDELRIATGETLRRFGSGTVCTSRA